MRLIAVKAKEPDVLRNQYGALFLRHGSGNRALAGARLAAEEMKDAHPGAYCARVGHGRILSQVRPTFENECQPLTESSWIAREVSSSHAAPLSIRRHSRDTSRPVRPKRM